MWRITAWHNLGHVVWMPVYWINHSGLSTHHVGKLQTMNIQFQRHAIFAVHATIHFGHFVKHLRECLRIQNYEVTIVGGAFKCQTIACKNSWWVRLQQLFPETSASKIWDFHQVPVAVTTAEYNRFWGLGPKLSILNGCSDTNFSLLVRLYFNLFMCLPTKGKPFPLL